MAQSDLDNSLKKQFEQIRDETREHANTATRIGNAFLSLMSYIGSSVNAMRGYFLRKDEDDVASGFIEFVKGLSSKALALFFGGATFGKYSEGESGASVTSSGSAEFGEVKARGRLNVKDIFSSDWLSGLRGFAVYHKRNGKSCAEIDELFVRVKAVFRELEIRKLSYVGGNIELSGAGGKIYKVTPIDDGAGNVVKYRCHLIRDDGTTRTRNWWQVGDMAKCQTSNLEAESHEETDDNGDIVSVWQNVSNRYYWRAVTAVGEETLDDGNTYNYIDLANTAEVVLSTWVDGEEVPMTYQGMDNVFEDFEADGHPAANDAPEAGDEIVQEGNLTNEDRQHMIRLCVVGECAPSIEEYVGINTYKLAPFRKTVIAPRTGDVFVAKRFEIMTDNGWSYRVPCDRGTYTSGMECYYYDRVSYAGALWLCVSKSGNVKTDGLRKVVIPPSADRDDIWLKQVDKGADGSDGKDTFVVDIDNEMTSIPLLEDGSVGEAMEIGFSLSAYYGLTDVTEACTVSLAGSAPEGWSVNIDTATSPKLSISAGATPMPTTTFRFRVSHPTYGSRDVTFSVAAIRAGGIGQDAVLYELLPSASALYVGRDADGNFTPEKISLTCGYLKRVGQMPAETVENVTGAFDGYNIYYNYRNRGTGEWSSYFRRYYTYKLLLNNMPTKDVDMFEFVISQNTSTIVTPENLTGVIDRETIPILTDGLNGTDGEDALTATLSPETVILTQSPADGSIDLQPAYTNVKVYKGMTDVTSDATISISETDGCTAGKPSPAAIVIDSLVGQPETGSVVISVTYQGVTVQKTFSFAINYLGKFKETIENDVKTQIASKEFYYLDTDGTRHRSSGISEIIQSSDKISQRVEKVEDGLLTARSEIVQQADRITLGVYGQNITTLCEAVMVPVDMELGIADSIKPGDEVVITCKTTMAADTSATITITLPDGGTIIEDVVAGEDVTFSVSKIITKNIDAGKDLTISFDGAVVIKNLTVVKRESVSNGLNRTGIDIGNGTIHLQAKSTVIDNDVTVGSLLTVPTTEGAYIKLSGGEAAVYGWNSKPSIVFGVDKTNGCAILRFCDSGGRPMYNLGPGGSSDIVNTAIADSWGDGVDCFKTRNGQKSSIVVRPIPGVRYAFEWSGKTYYQFNEGRFEGENGAGPVLVHGGRFDGKWYSTKEVKGKFYGENRGEPVSEDNLIPDGWYGCEEKFTGSFYGHGYYPTLATVKMRKFVGGKCVAVKDMDFRIMYYFGPDNSQVVTPDLDFESVEASPAVVARNAPPLPDKPAEPAEPMPIYIWYDSIDPDTVSGLE